MSISEDLSRVREWKAAVEWSTLHLEQEIIDWREKIRQVDTEILEYQRQLQELEQNFSVGTEECSSEIAMISVPRLATMQSLEEIGIQPFQQDGLDFEGLANENGNILQGQENRHIVIGLGIHGEDNQAVINAVDYRWEGADRGLWGVDELSYREPSRQKEDWEIGWEDKESDIDVADSRVESGVIISTSGWQPELHTPEPMSTTMRPHQFSPITAVARVSPPRIRNARRSANGSSGISNSEMIIEPQEEAKPAVVKLEQPSVQSLADRKMRVVQSLEAIFEANSC